MTTHHCHANNCPTPTAQIRLMCAKHWRMLPKAMQENIWAMFRARGNFPGQNPDKWAAYYEACAEAVEHVATMEGKDTANSYRNVAQRFRMHAERQENCLP